MFPDTLAGHDPLDSTTVSGQFVPVDLTHEVDIRQFRIGVPQEYRCEGMSEEVVEAWGMVANILEQAGAEVVQVS